MIHVLNGVDITPGRGDDVLVVDVDQARHLSDCGPVVAQLIGVNDLWDIIFTQQPRKEGFRGFSVSQPLKENVEHETVLIHSSPQPMSDAIDARTDLILSANSGRQH